MNTEIVCIVCPIGCRLTVVSDESSESGYKIFNNKCKRGVDYAIKEMTAPTRIIPTTVIIKNGFLKRLPVKTDRPVPKGLIFKIMKEINSIEVEAPVKIGDILLEDVLGTGSNIVATRSMKRI